MKLHFGLAFAESVWSVLTSATMRIVVFQMRSVSSAASVTAVSAVQVLLGASFDLHLLSLAFLSHRELMALWDQYETKGLFCALTFPSSVSLAQVTSTFHFYVSALKT